jgi:hypothetical protein
MTAKNIIEQLDDDLVLRQAVPEDSQALAKFNGTIHADPGEDFAQMVANWIIELTNGAHPTTKADDFLIVENIHTGEIVSSLCLIDQVWAYEGIEFPVGRPELVGTKEEYRRRGLVRRQFEEVHRWSAKRGQVLQFITGIPWFYRQFGYEMAVNLGGRRQGFLEHIPALKEDQEENFTFRQVEEKDISFVTELYRQSCQRSLLSCKRDEDIWRYEAFTRSPESDFYLKTDIIETPNGEPVGYLITSPTLYGSRLSADSFEVIDGVSWFDAAQSVLRRMKVLGEEIAAKNSKEDKKVEFTSFSFSLGTDHPIYHVIPHRMPRIFDPYAYYIRVPDLPGFLNLIAPVLEDRLARSYMSSHSGELKLNFFTDGINMVFENGKIKSIEPWEKPLHENGSAHFPELTFLQLLFGYRDVQALEDAYADIYYPKEFARPLLQALFPYKPSHVLELA